MKMGQKNEEKIEITEILDFIRIGIHQLGVQITTLNNLMIDKGIITEQEYSTEMKKVVDEINKYISEMSKTEAVEEDN
jgi:hypothetical protein